MVKRPGENPSSAPRRLIGYDASRPTIRSMTLRWTSCAPPAASGFFRSTDPARHVPGQMGERPARGGRKWQPSSVRHLLDEAQRLGFIRH